ncbi:mitotic-spindle organizing protein 2-like isoform 3-T7 [Chlamydotis macqueenii]
MSEAAAGMAAAMAEVRLRRKQLLSAEEAELFELAQAAGSGLDPEVFRVLLDLLRMNVAPLAVFQVLKSMCVGQRLPPGPEGGPSAAPAPLPADTRVSASPCGFAVTQRLLTSTNSFVNKITIEKLTLSENSLSRT